MNGCSRDAGKNFVRIFHAKSQRLDEEPEKSEAEGDKRAAAPTVELHSLDFQRKARSLGRPS